MEPDVVYAVEMVKQEKKEKGEGNPGCIMIETVESNESLTMSIA